MVSVLIAALALQAASPLDTMVDAGGYRLHLRVWPGSQSLTILFEAGGAADLTSWDSLPRLAGSRTGATIVAYDRAGLGSSEPGPDSLSPEAEVRGLVRALEHLGLPQRTLIVAHSYGAMMALAHAALFPARVGGLLLLDPMNPRFVDAMGDWLMATVPDIANPATNRERVIVRMKAGMPRLAEWLLSAEPDLQQPMVILTAGDPWWRHPPADSAWQGSHAAMAAVRPATRSLVVVQGSDHDIPGHAPSVVLAGCGKRVCFVGWGECIDWLSLPVS